MRTLGILADRAKKEEINLYTIGEWLDGQWEKTVVHPANDCNDLYSVSKNFTATAVGILCDRGQLSLEQSVYSLFHQEYPHCCGEKWKTVTVAHVLEQTVGIGSGFLDIDVEDNFHTAPEIFWRWLFLLLSSTVQGKKWCIVILIIILPPALRLRRRENGCRIFLPGNFSFPLGFKDGPGQYVPMGMRWAQPGCLSGWRICCDLGNFICKKEFIKETACFRNNGFKSPLKAGCFIPERNITD